MIISSLTNIVEKLDIIRNVIYDNDNTVRNNHTVRDERSKMASKDGFHRVAIKSETYEALVRLARENGRSIGGQIAWIVRQASAVRVEELPHPADAQSVPVVYANQNPGSV